MKAPDADAGGKSNAIFCWIERFGNVSESWEWFSNIGASHVGVTVGALQGTTNSQNPYLLTIDISCEYTVFGEVGLRRKFANEFRFEVGTRIEQRFGDWTFKDTVSGKEARG